MIVCGLAIFYILTGSFYLVDEWSNFLARIGRDENAQETDLLGSRTDVDELRFWASYRGQTLARTGKSAFFPFPISLPGIC